MPSEEIFNYPSIAIIGLGLIGGSIAKALKNFDQNIKISAFDKINVLEKGIQQKVIDVPLNEIEDAVNSEIIFLCLPVQNSIEVFEKLIPLLNSDTIITDVCGVKKIFEDIWNKQKQDGFYFGGHPMTGKEQSGFDNSDSLLFYNSIYILSETARNSDNAEKLINIIKMLGCKIEFLDPEVHDYVASNISHLPQVLAVALMNSVVKNSNEIDNLNFCGGGFKDMTRIASSDFKVWRDILKLNKVKISEALTNFTSELESLKSKIINEDSINLETDFKKANSGRALIKSKTKGFLNPLYDIFIFVKDEPGMLNKITSVLAKENINIKEIELLKMHEGSGGNFRIAFSSKEDAEKAKLILTEK